MPARQGAPLGAPCWIDLSTSDVDRAKQFYGAVFGWSFEDAGPEYGGYVNASKDGPPVAGMIHNDPQWNTPDGVVHLPAHRRRQGHVRRGDRRGRHQLGRADGSQGQGLHGGAYRSHRGALRAVAADRPSGPFVGEAGAPVYFQLTTRDYGKALDFYREVFGWQTETVADTDEFRYSTANFDGEALIGVMDGTHDLAEGVPSNWFFFLGADDVDKTVQLVVDNGGSVIRGAEDTPYGRLAAVADPTGAGFNLSSLVARRRHQVVGPADVDDA